MLIGIDWGGTKIEAVALECDGTERARRRISTPRDSYSTALMTLRDLIDAVEADAGARGSIGIGLPGSPSPKTGLIRNSNVTMLNGKALGRDLESTLGRPVRLANDANCLAVSEAVDGAGRGRHVVFGIIIGTGHGGGIAIDGAVHAGANGLAGEIGHWPLPWMRDDEMPGPACWCGRRGCMEVYASGTALERDYADATGVRSSGRQIIDAMREGEPEARAAYRRLADRLARGLALIVNTVDPDIFVLGGGLSHVGELYEDLPGLMAPHIFSDDASETPIAKAVHGDSSGVRGAAWLWNQSE